MAVCAKHRSSVVALSFPLRHGPDTQSELETGPDTFRLCPGVGLSAGGGQGTHSALPEWGWLGRTHYHVVGRCSGSLALGADGTRLHAEVHGTGLSRGGAATWEEPLLFFGEANRLQVSLIWEATHGGWGRAELQGRSGGGCFATWRESSAPVEGPEGRSGDMLDTALCWTGEPVLPRSQGEAWAQVQQRAWGHSDHTGPKCLLGTWSQAQTIWQWRLY